VQKRALHQNLWKTQGFGAKPHAALDIAWNDAHHSMMEQIIKHNLGYPGPANIAEGVD
jgi:hypothetical protein